MALRFAFRPARCPLPGSLILALALLFLGPGTPAPAAPASGLWLHVAVDEGGPGGSRVRVTVPLALAEAILPLINDGDVCNGKVKIDPGDLADTDLRALRAAVAAAKEGEFVHVRLDDDDVLASRSGQHLHLRVEDEDARVKIRVPIKLVDAILAAESAGHGEIDLVAAIKMLREQGAGEIVTVDDGTDQVRIWLDAKPDHD